MCFFVGKCTVRNAIPALGSGQWLAIFRQTNAVDCVQPFQIRERFHPFLHTSKAINVVVFLLNDGV